MTECQLRSSNSLVRRTMGCMLRYHRCTYISATLGTDAMERNRLLERGLQDSKADPMRRRVLHIVQHNHFAARRCLHYRCKCTLMDQIQINCLYILRCQALSHSIVLNCNHWRRLEELASQLPLCKYPLCLCIDDVEGNRSTSQHTFNLMYSINYDWHRYV